MPDIINQPYTTFCYGYMNDVTEAEFEHYLNIREGWRTILEHTPPKFTKTIKRANAEIARINKLLDPEPFLEKMRKYQRQQEERRKHLPTIEQIIAQHQSERHEPKTP